VMPWAMSACAFAVAQPDAALMQRLEAADAKAAAIHALATDFEQRKNSPLLREPMVSSGTVRVTGSVVRWDTTKPAPSVVRIDEREVRIFYPQEKLLEVYTLDEQLRQITASPLPRLAKVREQFEITEASDRTGLPQDPALLAIRLTPRQESLRKHLAEVLVAIDPATGVTRAMRMTDPEGEETRIEFKNPRINPDLSERDLDLHTPEGTRISRPLEGLGPGGGP
jgi:outer membrane lipoprotein carrier protein